MSNNVLTTIIVPEESVEIARRIASEAAVTGNGMFITGLSPTGELPATHFISSGLIATEFTQILSNGAYLYAAVIASTTERELETVTTEAEANHLADVAVVHNGLDPDENAETPHALIERLGLILVS